MTLKEQLMRDEGLRLKVYADSVGVPTIGYGRNLRDKGISTAEAERMLDSDLVDTVEGLYAALPWFKYLDDARFGVLVNMGFNLGVPGLLKFVKFLAFLKLERYGLAADEMLDSTWAKQVGPRAVRLAEQMRTGVTQ